MHQKILLVIAVYSENLSQCGECLGRCICAVLIGRAYLKRWLGCWQCRQQHFKLCGVRQRVGLQAAQIIEHICCQGGIVPQTESGALSKALRLLN
jgi:hypothetical protein